MKILVVQDYLRNGGTERQAVLLANGFATAHTVTLVTFRPGGVLRDTVAPTVRRRSLQSFDTGLDWFAPGLSRCARETQPDIVLCLGRMANCWSGRIQRAIPATTVIATMRTGKTLPWLFRRSLQQVRHVVANSRDAGDVLVRDYGVTRDRLSIIHNSLVFPAEMTAAQHAVMRAEVRALRGAGAGTTVLLCVAMFRPEKNQRALIEIVAGLSADTDFQLWLAGEGPARAACEARARALGVEHRVKFLGFVRDPTPLYAAADAAVHASTSDALSNFVIEAQAHGVPAVVFNGIGMSECLLPGRTGWIVPPGDSAAFRERLQAVMAEPPDTRSARAAAARQFARETFDPTRQVEAYLRLFRALTDPHRALRSVGASSSS